MTMIEETDGQTCDLCGGASENRGNIYVFKPVKADRKRGAERIGVCMDCVPGWMIDNE